MIERCLLGFFYLFHLVFLTHTFSELIRSTTLVGTFNILIWIPVQFEILRHCRNRQWKRRNFKRAACWVVALLAGARPSRFTRKTFGNYRPWRQSRSWRSARSFWASSAPKWSLSFATEQLGSSSPLVRLLLAYYFVYLAIPLLEVYTSISTIAEKASYQSIVAASIWMEKMEWKYSRQSRYSARQKLWPELPVNWTSFSILTEDNILKIVPNF